MLLPMLLNSMNPMLKEAYVCELLKTNEKTKEYGLELTVREAERIIEVRNNVLHSYGRVELGIEAAKELIEHFSSSSFIVKENYVSTLNELQEIFFYLKNETEDKISEDKLISIIKSCFEGSCGGSIELLRGAMEVFAKDFRRRAQAKDYFEEGNE